MHFLMVLFAPLILYKEVTLENRLNHKVVFVVANLEQALLHDGQLSFVYTNETRLRFSDRHLLSYLQVPIKENLFTKGPTKIDSAN